MTDRTKEPLSLKNVFVVEDDLLTRELIALSFEITHDGVTVNQFGRAQGVIEQVRDKGPDLITIDLGLPDGDGLSLIREIRRFSSIPIIVLSARHDDSTIVAAIGLGADSYLIKPSSIVAIQAHVQAVMRLSERAPHNIGSNSEIVIRESRIDIERGAVRIDGVWESLTKLELKIVISLFSAAGRIVLTGDLKSAVWGDPGIPDSTVKMAIYRLRQKIRDDDRADPAIVNHRNVGYSLDAS
jgi:two-component system KDP operon response regulator KdpE